MLPKTINLTDLTAFERSDIGSYVGTMLRVFELNVKNPAFPEQKNCSNVKGC